MLRLVGAIVVMAVIVAGVFWLSDHVRFTKKRDDKTKFGRKSGDNE